MPRENRFDELLPNGLFGIVIACQRPAARRLWWTGLALATLVHSAGAWALYGRRPNEAPPERLARVVLEQEVTLDPAPVAPPEPEMNETVPEPSRPEPQTSAPAQSQAAPESSEVTSPAQAGEVLSAAGPPDPLDFTGHAFTQGDGQRYIGGVTAKSGTNDRPVRSHATSRVPAGSSQTAGGGFARAVQLPAKNWRCPWPSQADALGINEQMVVLRAVVSAAGTPTSVEVLTDPGQGFGKAARECAKKVRFEPARDEQGRPHATTSPPIEVRFTR